MIPTSPDYIVDLNGNLRFTDQGLSEYGPYLAMADIDIRSIKHYRQYLAARQQASPYFIQYLTLRAKNWPDTEQFNLLRQALFQDDKPIN